MSADAPQESAERQQFHAHTCAHIHDTPEAKKSGQIWHHFDKTKYIKHAYLLYENQADVTISIYQDLSGKYQLELCFISCASLSREEAEREIERHKDRFIGFETEYRENDGLFSAFLIKTQQIGHYTDFHAVADSMAEQYGLTYLEPKLVSCRSDEVIPSCAMALVEEISSNSGHTTHSANTANGALCVDAAGPKGQKRKINATQTKASNKEKRKAKKIKQIEGQTSILAHFKKI